MEHDTHPTDLLPAYALGILEPAEQAEVESHLESCSECQDEVAVLLDVTGFLALAVPQLEAPEKVRQQLLEEARRTPAAESEDDGRWWQRAGGVVRRFMTLPAWRPAAAGLIILLLVVSNIYFLYRLQQVEEQPLPDQQTIRLGGTDAAPEANGIIFIRDDDPTGTLVVGGLPDLGPEQQYQLWLVRDEIRVSGAVFSVAEDGFTSINVSAPEALPLYTRFGITIEPAGGSPGPTGDGVLRYSGPERDGG